MHLIKNKHIKFLIASTLLTTILSACNSGNNNNQPEFESVVNYKIGHGIFSGVLKNKSPFSGKADNIDYSSGVYSGTIESGNMVDGKAVNVKYNDASYVGTFSGVINKNTPHTGASITLCKIKLNECFTGKIYRNFWFDGELTKDGHLYQIKQGGPTNGYSIYQSSKKTPFQRFLLDYESSKTDENLKFSLLGKPGLGNSLSIEDKVDVNNDNIRRFFETAVGKNLLIHQVKDPTIFSKLRILADNLLAMERFMMTSDGLYPSATRTSQEKAILNRGKDWYADWLRATNGKYTKGDFAFAQLSLTIDRHTKKLQDPKLGLNAAQQNLLLDLYRIHYLSYKVQEGPLWKYYFDKNEKFIDVYETEPLYVKRGRLDIKLFKMSTSRHMGILRWNDVGKPNSEYMDMDKPIYSLDDNKNSRYDTRCPDRFNMERLDSTPNLDGDSWLTYNFNNGVSPVVNGPSGSMLVELKFLLLANELLRNVSSNNQVEMKRYGIKSNFLQNVEDIRSYLRIIYGEFLYLEGGHSIYEIGAPIDLPLTQQALQKLFTNQKLDMRSLLLDGNISKMTIESSIEETLDFYHHFDMYKKQMINLKADDSFLSWNPV